MKSRTGLLAFVVLVGMASTLTREVAGQLASAAGSQAGWPQWRGPNRDNISSSTNLLNAWPAAGPKLLWKTAGLGEGFSSVAIAGDHIYTLGDRRGGQYVLALRLSDGKELWNRRISNVWSPEQYSGPRCTPSIDGKLLYALSTHGDLVCLNVDDGRPVWSRNLAKDFKGVVQGKWGYSESPLIDGDRLICTPGGPNAGIVALDKKTGKDIWKTKIPLTGRNGDDGAGYSSVVISHGAGVKQYVQFTGRGVVGVAAADGKYLWGYNRVANATANIPTPLISGDYVFASSGYQTGSALLKLEKKGAGVACNEVYFLDSRDFQNHHGGMVMIGDYIYAGHGHKAGSPTCIDWKTGKIVWRHNRGPGTGSSCLTYADGNLYMRFEDGVMALIGATPSEYQEKGKFEIPNVDDPSWAYPVIVDGRLYLREQNALYCYDVRQP